MVAFEGSRDLATGQGLFRRAMGALPIARGDTGFRWLVLGCQLVTVLITWPLWQEHDSPPMLPLVELPGVDVGVLLLITLVLVLVAPLPGLIAHTAVILYAIALDQTRMQPEVISLAILMWGTLPNAAVRAIARTHLIALWFYAGFNKLLSPDFMHGTAQWMLSAYTKHPPEWLDDNFGYLVGLAEVSIALLAILPGTRRAAGFAALLVHAGILIDLSPLGHNWNESVWPWNVALGVAGFAMIAPWREKPAQSLRSLQRAVQPVIVLLLVSPLGFYVGVTDAYLSYNLYTSNTARAKVSCEGKCLPYQQPASTWDAFDVPLPPEHRLFRMYFEKTCRPGDRLVIEDSRWWYRRKGEGLQQIACPVNAN